MRRLEESLPIMKILIAGAGIGGMALAALLRQRGIEASLIDRAPSFGHAGYMLTLYPIGSRVLHGLGLFDDFVSRSADFRYYEVNNGQGELLHRFDMSVISDRFGYTGQILRSDLLEILHSAVRDTPLRMGISLTDLRQRDGKVHVTLSDGAEETYDAVIGADGIHSQTRRLLFGNEPDRDTGWGLWVWWTDLADYPRDTVREFWGRGRLVGIYPTPSRIGAVAAAPRELIEDTTIEGDGAKVRELFAGMEGGAAEVMETFPESTENLFFWNLADFRSSTWIQGRVALLGDAACSFLPTAGVGASMALESAAVMADELSRTDAKFLPNSLSLYEKRRKHRAEAAQDDSRKLAAWMTTNSHALAWTRDHFMKVASVESLAGSIAKSLADPI